LRTSIGYNTLYALPLRKSDWRIIAGVILALVVVALCYIGGHFALSTIHDMQGDHYTRFFDSKLVSEIYAPAAELESAIRGKRVLTVGGP
jgi:hypothetical protein